MTHDTAKTSPAAPPAAAAPGGGGTALVEVQRSRLVKTLRRADLVYFVVAAVISIDTIGLLASSGAQGLLWSAFLAVAFLVPYALVFADTSAAHPGEGGPYQWVREAFGRFWAAIAVVFYWITNPIWLGGSLAFVAGLAWTEFVLPGATGLADFAFKLVFVWAAILLAIVSLQRGKWVVTAGAVAKLAVLASLCVTAVVYGLQEGFTPVPAGDFVPSAGVFLAVVPVALFAYVGFEAPSAASDEMHDAQKDTPVAIARGALITMLAYVAPVAAIVFVTPADEIADAGVMATVQRAYGVYGAAAEPLVVLTALAFILALLSQGSAWMMATDRMQAVAAADGGFFSGWLGEFSERFGTPVRMNLVSGVVSTVFLVAATTLVEGPAASVFAVVLTVAVSTLLFSYLVIVPAMIRLRLTSDAPRPFRVPGDRRGFVVLASVVLAFVVLGSWAAVFPGTLEALLGIDYDFVDAWGTSRLAFEAFTLGTLAVVVALGVVGYLRGARLRSSSATGSASR
ncbi:MAG: APC family permease [Quadrisphaera sp.]